MTRLMEALRDAWCAITGRCGWDQATRTDTMEYLKEQQEESLRKVGEADARIQRVNILERRLVPQLRDAEEGQE